MTTISSPLSPTDLTKWDERALLLLGVLMVENQHGYQINDFIEDRLCSVIAMKKPTAYALLERLEKSHAVTVHMEQEGGRPPRKVYALTDYGRELFLELLRHNLAQSTLPGYASEIGLIFMSYLTPHEAVKELRERKLRLEQSLAEIANVPMHGPTLRIDLAMAHKLAMGQAELAWLGSTIDHLEQS